MPEAAFAGGGGAAAGAGDMEGAAGGGANGVDGVEDHVGVAARSGAAAGGAAGVGGVAAGVGAAGVGAADAARAAGGAADGAPGADPGRVSICPRMSCLVTRPAIPVPGTWRMSTLCSAAILRTTGDERVWRSSSGVMSARGFSSAGGEGGAGAGAGADACGGRELGGGAGAGAPAGGAEGHVGADVALPGAGVPDDGAGLDGGGVNAAVEAGLDGADVPSAGAAATDGLVGCAAATDGLVGCAAATDWLVGWGAFGGAAADPGGTAEGALVLAAADGAALATSPSPMMATTVLMGTVAPGSTRISLSTPEAGAGISASTLSVEISKRGSSRWTRSPTFFIHLVIVPSAIDSPIWGMMTSVIGPPRCREATHRSRGRRRPPPPA